MGSVAVSTIVLSVKAWRRVQTNDDALHDQRRPYEVLPQGDEGITGVESGHDGVDVP